MHARMYMYVPHTARTRRPSFGSSTRDAWLVAQPRPCFSILNTSGRQNVRMSEQRKPLTSPVGRHLISGTYRRTQQIEQHTCLILCLRTLVTQVLIANTLSFRSRVARRRGGTRTSIRGLDIGVFHETPGSRVGTRTRTGVAWTRPPVIYRSLGPWVSIVECSGDCVRSVIANSPTVTTECAHIVESFRDSQLAAFAVLEPQCN